MPKTARKLGVSPATLNGWVSFDTQALGTSEGATLSGALQALREMTGEPVALIVDEARQARVSAEGESTMRALKSARDEMNSPDETGLPTVRRRRGRGARPAGSTASGRLRTRRAGTGSRATGCRSRTDECGLPDHGSARASYDAAAIGFCRERLDAVGSTRKLDAQTVQKALRKLREGEPALVWKSARGEYAPQDSGMHGWYDELRDAGEWPPGASSAR